MAISLGKRKTPPLRCLRNGGAGTEKRPTVENLVPE
jgi:hypothetical protein